MSTAEAELTAGSLPASEDAFRAVFLEYYPLVYALALRVTGRREAAEDVAQEVFLKLFALWPGLRLRLSLKAWLARTTLNLTYNGARFERRQAVLLERAGRMEISEEGPSVEELVELAAERRMVAEVLNKLKYRDRCVLLLRHSGLSYQEVADAAGIRPSSVGQILARSEERFRRAYEQLSGRNELP